MRVRAAQEGGGQVGAGRGLGARVSRCAPKPRDTVGCAFCWLEARGRPCAALRSAREGAFVSGGRTEGRSYYRFLITDLSRLRVQGGSSMTPSTSPYVRPNVRSRTTYDWTWPLKAVVKIRTYGKHSARLQCHPTKPLAAVS